MSRQPADENEYDVLDEDVARVSPLKHATCSSAPSYCSTAQGSTTQDSRNQSL